MNPVLYNTLCVQVFFVQEPEQHVRAYGIRTHLYLNVIYSTVTTVELLSSTSTMYTRRYFQHAHFILLVSVGKRGEYQLVHGDLPRQYPFGTTLRFTGPVPADSRQ